MEAAIEAGADDVQPQDDGSFEIYTVWEDLGSVRDAIEAAGFKIDNAEVTMIPQTWVELTDENDIKKMNRILDLLDEDDDVQNVYHNWNMPEDDDE